MQAIFFLTKKIVILSSKESRSEPHSQRL